MLDAGAKAVGEIGLAIYVTLLQQFVNSILSR
jgi:hypothetical protein